MVFWQKAVIGNIKIIINLTNMALRLMLCESRQNTGDVVMM